MIPVAEPDLTGNELKYVSEAVTSGWVTKGKFVSQFEERVAEYVGVRHGIATPSGTTALHLALHALGIGKGDEVIIPVFTYAAVAHAVSYTGATPVLVDIGEDLNLNPTRVEAAITSQTKAILAVDTYGMPCDMDRLSEIAVTHHLNLIEDISEALGATYHNQKVGSFGDVAICSFYGNKLITTGEGGMVLTSHEWLANRCRHLQNHSMTERYVHDRLGFNYCMANINAALGVAQMERIDEFLEKKRTIHSWYEDRLELNTEIIGRESSYWMNCLWVSCPEEKIKKLKEAAIEARPFFTPLNLLPHYQTGINFLKAERIATHGINLPSSVKLTLENVNYVIDNL